jgi:hypothetical protein
MSNGRTDGGHKRPRGRMTSAHDGAFEWLGLARRRRRGRKGRALACRGIQRRTRRPRRAHTRLRCNADHLSSGPARVKAGPARTRARASTRAPTHPCSRMRAGGIRTEARMHARTQRQPHRHPNARTHALMYRCTHARTHDARPTRAGAPCAPQSCAQGSSVPQTPGAAVSSRTPR